MKSKTEALFDDIPLETWKLVLNENMDYHFNDKIFHNPIFENVSTVLDVGCGWGGSLRDLKKLYNIEATGLTESLQQYEYITEHDVILADANTWVSDRIFDLVMFIQTFTHMEDQALVLRSYNTDKIFVSDFMIKDKQEKVVPDWKMVIRTEDQYRNLFEKIGFDIKSFKVQPRSMYKRNAKFWLKNIQKNKVTNGWQINVLERFCKDILSNRHHNIFICDIYAERM